MYGDDITERLLSKISPKANHNTCPYCGTVHPFSATRARKCPECGKKMIVRKGAYYTEKDIEKFDSESKDYYEKTQQVERLKSVLQNIQDNKLDNNYGRCFLYIAEAYDYCAVIKNQSFEGGFTFWDYAWGVLNKDALEVVSSGSNSQNDLIMNGYSDVLYARAMHLMRELKNSTSDKSKSKYAKIAVSILIEYLYELSRHQVSDWHEEEAPKLIQVAIKLSNIEADWIDKAAVKTLERSNNTADNKHMDSVVNTVKSYTLIESDPEQLKWLIY